TKIFDRVYETRHCASVFALTGTIPYAKSAIESCESRISKLDHLSVSLEEIRQEIEACLAEFYQTHIYPHPNPELVDFGLLIGIWLRGETRMFASWESTVTAVRDHECLGTGAYLAKYWTRKFFASEEKWKDESRTLEDVALISAYALKSVMDYDESCGGQAEFMIMKNDGEFGYEVDTALPFHPCDEIPDQIHAQMWKMLRKLIRAEDSDSVSSISWNFEYEVGKIIEKRAAWIRMLTSNLKNSIAKTDSDSS
ncbi:MAG: hypothetical protein ACRD52_13945, partial [Candidatus Acidiferrales bacterium]